MKHRTYGKIRVLMRQEKTMKVIVNHCVDPRITLSPNAGSDRSWVWSAYDFSGGDLEETVFAMRFRDSEASDKFKEMFEKAKEEMAKELEGADAEDTAAGDELAGALEGATVAEEEEGDKAAEPAEEAPNEETA